MHCFHTDSRQALLEVTHIYPLQEEEFPQLYRYILHPCVTWYHGSKIHLCGGFHTASSVLRWQSYLSQKNVVIMLMYEVIVPTLDYNAVLLHSSTPCCIPSSCSCCINLCIPSSNKDYFTAHDASSAEKRLPVAFTSIICGYIYLKDTQAVESTS